MKRVKGRSAQISEGGHITHTKNIELINMALDNGVEILFIPPHSRHKIKPLNKSFMRFLKKFIGDTVILKKKSREIRNRFRITAKQDTVAVYSASSLNFPSGFLSRIHLSHRGIRDDFKKVRGENEQHFSRGFPPADLQRAGRVEGRRWN
ncbi:hypothetical protein EVAR_49955_1 [Eumeta japonica]|uniref:DDE-1 domain-containing protein n=1 Tax=Eumeta variegata TaxID=151549 RepID=A0A4C1XV32_EUMVA|nr:hypothetical protein EVAR_49955_1 [Eumeta japonica]